MSPWWSTSRVRACTTVAMLLALVALVVGVTVFVVHGIEPGGTFAPLVLSGRFYLTNGTADTPPQIAFATPLTFNAGKWCNTSTRSVASSISIAIRGGGTPPQRTVPVVVGVMKSIEPGCVENAPLNLSPPDPPQPGVWRLVVTVTATEDSGRAQVKTVTSEPFVVSGQTQQASPTP